MISDFVSELLLVLGAPEDEINPKALDAKIVLITTSLKPHETMVHLCRLAQMIVDDGRLPTAEEDTTILKPTDSQVKMQAARMTLHYLGLLR